MKKKNAIFFTLISSKTTLIFYAFFFLSLFKTIFFQHIQLLLTLIPVSAFVHYVATLNFYLQSMCPKIFIIKSCKQTNSVTTKQDFRCIKLGKK